MRDGSSGLCIAPIFSLAYGDPGAQGLLSLRANAWPQQQWSVADANAQNAAIQATPAACSSATASGANAAAMRSRAAITTAA